MVRIHVGQPAGCSRTFAITPAAQSRNVANPTGSFTVEIPMIYIRFLQARQNALSLPTASDFNHQLNVRVTDLATPIVVSYRLPFPVWVLTGAGLLGLARSLAPEAAAQTSAATVVHDWSSAPMTEFEDGESPYAD